MKPAFFAIFCLLLYSLPAFAQQNNKLYWSEPATLAWAHFTAPVPASRLSAQAANMQYKMEMDYKASMVGDSLLVRINIRPVFIKTQSWADPARVNQTALAFEQLKFDLVELHARQLRKELAATDFTPASLQKQIQQAYDSTLSRLEETIKQYSSESFFGTRRQVQQQWRKETSSALQDLSAWQYQPPAATK